MTVLLFYQDLSVLFAQAETDSAGNYAFNNLAAGLYIIVETNLLGYIDVFDTFDNPLDSTIFITLVEGQNETGLNFVDQRVGLPLLP